MHSFKDLVFKGQGVKVGCLPFESVPMTAERAKGSPVREGGRTHAVPYLRCWIRTCNERMDAPRGGATKASFLPVSFRRPNFDAQRSSTEPDRITRSMVGWIVGPSV